MSRYSNQISLERARDFVYQHGALWERALFAHLFEGGPRERVIRCLACYQNEDGGWGHALEHDVRSPASHAVATEYALGVMLEYGLADEALLARTAAWCEANQTEEGDFPLGEAFHRYPRAPWWQEARSWPPDAIAGRLAALNALPPNFGQRTAAWVERSLSMDELRGLDVESWRYRLYHYADYFMNIDAPDVDMWRPAVLEKVWELARAQPNAEAALGWGWATRLGLAAIPHTLIEKRLTALAAAQQEDGGWPDPHGLLQWRPMQTIWALKVLA
jgi:hypothetical protein